jgi:hypothetical protein
MGESFVRVQFAPAPNPADEAIVAAREADAAQRLNRAEAGILWESLSPERQAEIARAAMLESGNATRTVLQPDGSTITDPLGVQRSDIKYQPETVTGMLVGAHNPSGRRMWSWSDVSDVTVFQKDGHSIPAPIAARLGLIAKNPDGRYGPVEASVVAPPEVPEESPVEDFHSPEMKEMRGNLEAMAGSPAGANVIVGSVIARAIDGDIANAGKTITEHFGHDPADAQRDVQAAIQDGVISAARHLTAQYGVDGPAALQWVSENLPKSERVSLAHRIYLGDKTAFQYIANRFRRAEAGRDYSARMAELKKGRS